MPTRFSIVGCPTTLRRDVFGILEHRLPFPARGAQPRAIVLPHLHTTPYSPRRNDAVEHYQRIARSDLLVRLAARPTSFALTTIFRPIVLPVGRMSTVGTAALEPS
jgi:hypothetical protein